MPVYVHVASSALAGMRLKQENPIAARASTMPVTHQGARFSKQCLVEMGEGVMPPKQFTKIACRKHFKHKDNSHN